MEDEEFRRKIVPLYPLTMISGWVAALSVSGLAVAGLDRWTKSLAIAELPEGEFRRVLWRSGFRRVQNVRVGLVTVSPGQAIAAWLVCVASLLLLLRYLPDLPVAAATGLGAVVGGASANLFDRLRHGSVTDFIVVGRWPTFNLADAGMVVGCLLAAWSAR